MTVVCKCLNTILSGIMNDILAVSKHQYNTRHYKLFVTDCELIDMVEIQFHIKLVRYGTNCPVK